MSRIQGRALFPLVVIISLLSGQFVGRSLAQSSVHPDWRQQPIKITPDADGHLADIRGQIADSLIGLPEGIRLGSEDASHQNVSVSMHERSMEELPKSSDVIVVATFANYEVHESPSGRSLYTIVYLKVDSVISDRAGLVRNGQSVPVLLLGGSARLPAGSAVETVSYGIPQAGSSLLPSHRYLAFLHFNKEGEIFEVEKTWDMSTGKAVPTSYEDKQRVRSGTSVVAGKSEETVVTDLKSALER